MAANWTRCLIPLLLDPCFDAGLAESVLAQLAHHWVDVDFFTNRAGEMLWDQSGVYEVSFRRYRRSFHNLNSITKPLNQILSF